MSVGENVKGRSLSLSSRGVIASRPRSTEENFPLRMVCQAYGPATAHLQTPGQGCRCASVARTLVRKGKGVKTGAENEPLTLPRKNCTRSASCTAARICSHPHRRARGEALAIGGTTPYMAKTGLIRTWPWRPPQPQSGKGWNGSTVASVWGRLRAAPFVNQWKDAPATVARCDRGRCSRVSTTFARGSCFATKPTGTFKNERFKP